MTRLDRSGLSALEPRERELLAAYIELGGYKAVGQRMGLTEQTVKNMASHILATLDVTSIGQAVVLFDRRAR